jgi:tetratricopeptide (TPR) repeat protein
LQSEEAAADDSRRSAADVFDDGALESQHAAGSDVLPGFVIALLAWRPDVTASAQQQSLLEANKLYAQQAYAAAAKYEEALIACNKTGTCTDPTISLAYFYQGNSYDNLYRPTRRGDLAYYTMATYYWDTAYRDFRLSDQAKTQYVLQGIDTVNKAIEIKPEYIEALAYKNLLLRLQANLEKDPAKAQDLLRQADELREKALALRKK